MRIKLILPFAIILSLLSGAKLAAADAGYILCQAGEGYVYLYQTADNFQVLANLRCGQRVEIVDSQDNARARVRTADGKEGYIPRSGLTASATGSPQEDAAPASSSAARPEPASAPAPAASGGIASAFRGYSGNGASGSDEREEYSRIEIFGSYSLEIPAPSWGLPSNTRGIGMDTSASINLKRWVAVEGEFGWNRATANFGGVTVIDRSMLFSGGPRYAYRQGRLGVFAHALVGANRISVSSSVPGIAVLGVPFPGATMTDTSLAAVIGAGADIEISRHIALRDQADYLPTHHLSQMQNNHRFSFGVVIKL